MDEMNPNETHPLKERDDFQQIKGVGSSIAHALYELGIYHFTDLANMTAQQLANLLRPKVAFITVQRIERDDWIGQARAHVKEEKQSTPARENWRELAVFFVTFGEEIGPKGEMRLQTKAHYIQGDLDKKWEGIAKQELTEWLLEQAQLPEPPEAASLTAQFQPEPSEDRTDSKEEAFELVLTDLWVSQVKMPALPEGQLVQSRVRVEANLDVPVEEGYPSPPEAIYFTAEIILENLQTNESIFFENPREEIFPEALPYQLQYDIQVPPPGRYQISLLIRHLPSGKDAARVKGPILIVK